MHPTVPPGQSSPFEVIDNDHRGAVIIIAGAMGLVLSLGSFLVRLYVRLVLCPPFAYDDFISLAATIFAIAESSLVFGATSQGFGMSFNLLSSHDMSVIETLIPTSHILYLITIYLTKCCMLATYLRLTSSKRHNQASWLTLAVCTAWVITAVFIIALDCEFSCPWRGFKDGCSNLVVRWRYIVAVDILTELALVGLAITLLNGLYMYLVRKVALWVAFLFRLPIIIFAILHVYSVRNIKGPDTASSQIVNPDLWAQVQLNYALIACSVLCLRPFMVAASTNGGGLETSPSVSRGRVSGVVSEERDWDRENEELEKVMRDERGGDRRIGSRHASVLQRSGSAGSGTLSIQPLRPGSAVVSRGSDTEKMIIRKEIEYSVEYGDNEMGTKEALGTENWGVCFRETNR